MRSVPIVKLPRTDHMLISSINCELHWRKFKSSVC